MSSSISVMLQVKSNPGRLKGDQGLQRKFRKWYVSPFHPIFTRRDFEVRKTNTDSFLIWLKLEHLAAIKGFHSGVLLAHPPGPSADILISFYPAEGQVVILGVLQDSRCFDRLKR